MRTDARQVPEGPQRAKRSREGRPDRAEPRGPARGAAVAALGCEPQRATGLRLVHIPRPGNPPALVSNPAESVDHLLKPRLYWARKTRWRCGCQSRPVASGQEPCWRGRRQPPGRRQRLRHLAAFSVHWCVCTSRCSFSFLLSPWRGRVTGSGRGSCRNRRHLPHR